MRYAHGTVESITAFLATIVAGLSLTLPIDFRWGADSGPLQLNSLADSQPRAIAAGAIVAVIVSTFAATALNELVAWCTALFGGVVLFVNHVLGQSAGPESSLTTLNFIDALAGGVLLGGLGAAVLHRRISAFGWTVGAIGSIVIAEALPTPFRTGAADHHVRANWVPGNSPPTWMIGLVLALIAISAYLNRHQPPANRLSVELPMAPIVTGVILITSRLFIAGWIARHAHSVLSIAIGAVITVLVAGVAALLLPGRDGLFVLLAAALTASGNAMVPADIPQWSVPILILLCAVAVVVGVRCSSLPLALTAAAALALGAVLLTHVHNTVTDAIAEVAVVLVAGYCLGTSPPRHSASRVLAIVILLVPSLILALRARLAFGVCDPSGIGRTIVCDFDERSSAAPGWTAFAMIVGYSIFVYVISRRPLVPDAVPATPRSAPSA
ncbi:hypothetical protein [Nocardia macrotermitis]|uniref:Uncharacterized protein n=1 Tax=Nocardia macrotermitis TaxID=2585198 RepID=A0A7K0DDA2_9NOCA|nr:hypothetical protein [Nocardia macrotermitis]MQY22864.1 hypothetical protein [Nocardia macrotermitis]